MSARARPLPPEEEAALAELQVFPDGTSEEGKEILRAIYRSTCRMLRKVELGWFEEEDSEEGRGQPRCVHGGTQVAVPGEGERTATERGQPRCVHEGTRVAVPGGDGEVEP